MQNGLELLAMTGGGEATAEMSLIKDSCASAAARIRFFRVAFGTASSGQAVSAKEVSTTLDRYTSGSRIQTVWKIAQDLPRDQVQLAFIAFLCCESALPAGGTITCDAENGKLTISATAPRIKVEPTSWAFLEGEGIMADMAPDRVHFALLSVLASDRGIPLSASAGDAGVQIQIVP